MGVQGGQQYLDIGKLLGGAEPLKEEEDMWFRQQNRSTALPVCLSHSSCCVAYMVSTLVCYSLLAQHSICSFTASGHVLSLLCDLSWLENWP